MRNDDERQVLETIVQAESADRLSDPTGFLADFDQLVVSDEKKDRQLAELKQELREKEIELRKYRSEAEQYRAKVEDISATLQRLRRSGALRVGRTISRPVRVGMTAFSPIYSKSRARFARMKSRLGGVSSGISGPLSARAASETSAERAAEKYDGLQRAASNSPTLKNVINLMHHCYFVQGKIRETASLGQRYGELLHGADNRTKQLSTTVLGLDRVYEREMVLPPRQINAGYVVEPRRVMYCAHSTIGFNSNGYSTRTAGLGQAIAGNGVELIVVARPGYPWDVKTDRAVAHTGRFEEVSKGVRYIYTPGPSWPRDPLDQYLEQAADAYVREAVKHRVSVIHAASNYVTAYPALVAARRLGIPFMYEVRGLWEITEASYKDNWISTERFALAVQMERAVANNADGILAITPQVGEQLVARGTEPGKIRILPNAVDSEEFSPLRAHQATRSKLKLPMDAVVVGYAGSLVAYEGLTDLLDAAALVMKQRTDVVFVVVGDGAALPALKQRVRELNISDSVIFTGRVRPQDVPLYISVFDIMPCTRTALPVTELVSPLKPLEAMAAGKAVVMSDLAPLRDIAGENSERALLVEAGNPEHISRALLDLAADDQKRMNLGRRARQWIVQNRTWGAVSHTVCAEYARLTDRNEANNAKGRHLSALTVGLIADVFTTEGLRVETNIIELLPSKWEQQLADTPIDALVVESAWEGGNGAWHRKVGYYDEESFSNLKELLAWCQRSGIPTIFWNKEDPVHFNRFRKTSMFFEHIFTTDSNSVVDYLRSAGARQKTVASLPFYAQPRLHNPLPSRRPYSHTAAYAGSYYGDRYRHRSDQLRTLLSAAATIGLTIYDRQHLDSESPYTFPPELGRYVAGGLTYPDMVEAYKAHPVHLNVNSVEDSPTMFSRRVVETAASGGAVISGPGLGVEDVFDGRIAVVSQATEAELLINRWMTREDVRKRDAWLGMRTVLRAHTAAHRLSYMLRTAGLEISAPALPDYAVLVDRLTPAVVQTLSDQSVAPVRVLYFDTGEASLPKAIDGRPYSAHELKQLERDGIPFVGTIPPAGADRVYFEDLLTSTLYGAWEAVAASEDGLHQPGRALATPVDCGLKEAGLVLANKLNAHGNTFESVRSDQQFTNLRGLQLSRHGFVASTEIAARPQVPSRTRKKVIIAGHDLKFATKIVDELNARGHEVVIDQWASHTQHDEVHSAACLKDADVIFCEWALGNAVWYSKNKSPRQRMVVRFHLQEMFTTHPEQIEMESVDEMIFVGAHLRDTAIRDYNMLESKCRVIPNYVDPDSLERAKDPASRFNLGFVGIVPRRKRLDLALDVLATLRQKDDRYRLFVKGKTPADFSWMAKRQEEMQYYEAQYERIENDPQLAGAVIFDGFSTDMADWYQKIGVVLSVSDFESFHLTLPDGAVSGALPASLAWAGADRIYPQSWLHSDVPTLSSYIMETCTTKSVWRVRAAEASAFATRSFAKSKVLSELAEVIVG